MNNAERTKRDQKMYALYKGEPHFSYREIGLIYQITARQVGTIVRRIEQKRRANT